eukprot:14261771-Alexandrium_andersonii.AAC.1
MTEVFHSLSEGGHPGCLGNQMPNVLFWGKVGEAAGSWCTEQAQIGPVSLLCYTMAQLGLQLD